MITSFAILLILMAELKVCGWRVSARGSGERSEPAAGRPRKEQAPKAPSRIASLVYMKEAYPFYLSSVFRCGHSQKIGKSWSRA